MGGDLWDLCSIHGYVKTRNVGFLVEIAKCSLFSALKSIPHSAA